LAVSTPDQCQNIIKQQNKPLRHLKNPFESGLWLRGPGLSTTAYQTRNNYDAEFNLAAYSFLKGPGDSIDLMILGYSNLSPKRTIMHSLQPRPQ
jgi:hypothetical protein